MSKYTTEVRYIVESYAGNQHTGASGIADAIDKAIPYLFDESWSTFEPEHKKVLCEKVLKHYYFREIGYETVPLWTFALNRRLAEIMPLYNKMYELTADAYHNALDTYRMSESEDVTDMTNATTNSTSNGNSTSTGSTNDTSTSRSNSTTNSDSTSTSEAWQKYNDTPQGGIQGLDADMYLTNATKNVSDTTGNTGGTSDTTADTQTITTSDNSTQNSSADHIQSDSNRNENRNKEAHGYNGADTLMTAVNVAMEKYLNVDMLIIAQLEDLFIQLW